MDAVYVSTTEFSVAGDLTASFITDRRAKVDCGGDGIKYANIVSSLYSNPNTIVTISESTLTSNVAFAWYGVVQPGESGSLPIHTHSSSEGDGGNITIPSTFLNLSDTPGSYSVDKFAKSTASGVVWEDYNFEKLNGTPATYDDGKYLKSTVSGSEWSIVPDQTTFSGTSVHTTTLFVDGDATVTGTMYAHVYDSYSPLVIKDGGVDILVGDGVGNVDFPEGITVEGDPVSGGASSFVDLDDTPSTYSGTAGAMLVTTAFGVEFAQEGRWFVDAPDQGNYDNLYIDSTTHNVYRHNGGTGIGNDANTVLLMHMDGENSGTVFTDDGAGPNCPHGLTITSAVTSTAAYKFGATSAYFNGSSRISVDDHADWDFGTGDFCIDFWLKTASSSLSMLLNTGNGNLSNEFQVEINRTSGKVGLYSGSQYCTSTTSVNDDEWYHIAYERVSGMLYVYINGTQENSVAFTNNFTPTGLHIGAAYNLTAGLTGYIDELRISDTYRYNGNFTVFSGPYSASSENWDSFGSLSPSFTDLTDTPSTYSGTEGQYLTSTGSGVEWSNSAVLHYGDTVPETEFGNEGDYFLHTPASGIYVKHGDAFECTSFTANVTTEGYTIGQESPSYTGGAFDGITGDGNATGSWYCYHTASYQTTGWTGQDFGDGNEKTLVKYRIYNNNVNSAPRSWTFEASVSGTWTGEEVVLDTVSDYAFTASLEWHDFTFYNNTAYRYYRLNVSANNGNPTYLVVREIEMMECSTLLEDAGWNEIWSPVPEAYDSVRLRAPDNGLWDLKVTNSGTLYTTEVI